jgi:hypothetical protein
MQDGLAVLRIKPVFEGHILSQTVNSANSLKNRHLPAAGRKGPIYALPSKHGTYHL